MNLPAETDIFSFIKRRETLYKQDIIRNEKSWNMYTHIHRSTLYAESDIVGTKDKFTPVKNIIRPILNLQHRSEDIDVKDVQIYIDDADLYHLSFLVKKYHDEVFTVENDLDTFFDELNVSRIDYGLGLSKLVKNGRETVPLMSIAFCDQRDILSRPIGLKHSYGPDELLDMESKGWGKPANGATISVEDLIKLSRTTKKEGVSENDIEIYEVHGSLPKKFSTSGYDGEDYETRLYICAFYQKEDSLNDSQGVILYTKPEKETPFKVIKRDPLYGRACGWGGVEELFEAQVWTNYSEKRKIDMLDAASKTIILSEDPAFTQKNKVSTMDNLSVANVAPGAKVYKMDTVPNSINLFENAINTWEEHGRNIGGAEDPVQGKEPTAGTPFASLQAQIQQGMALHEYRRGQFAKHIEQIYQDDYLPQIAAKITAGTTFLAELSLDELQYVTDCVVTKMTNERVKDIVLKGGDPTQDQIDVFKQLVQSEFKKKGNKLFLEILKGEFKNVKLKVKVDVAGKSKALGKAVDSLTNIFRFVFSNPQGFMQVMQIPGMAKSFNDILEFSGISPVNFAGIDKYQLPAPQQPVAGAPTAPQGAPQGQPSPLAPNQPQAA